MTRFSPLESPPTLGSGPQSALLRAATKSVVIWLPETVRVTSPSEAAPAVALPTPTMALWGTPADNATAPPVKFLGRSPTRKDGSSPPPELEGGPVAATKAVPGAGHL